VTDYGIDVSSFNTITDWAATRTANSWAWAKATQGSSYTSSAFAAQMAGGQRAGVAMGAYHFPDPRVSVATNVTHFVSIARTAGAFATGAFLPMLDMENSPGDGITWSAAGANGFIAAFRDGLRAATGVQQLCVYASESWWASGFLQPFQWADSNVVLCAAQYTGQPGQLGWSHPRLAVHQYTDEAPTPGAAGKTDRSVILAPYSLTQLTIGGSVSPSTSSPEEDDMPFWVQDNKGNTLCISNGRMLAAVNGSKPPAGALVWSVGPDEYAGFSTKEQEAAAVDSALVALPGKLDAVLAAIAAAGTGSTTNVTAAVPTAWKATDLGNGVTEIKAEVAP
jgi:GH25 family lysozyme M1 (1,4-beta-N-acetylmuramidase)